MPRSGESPAGGDTQQRPPPAPVPSGSSPESSPAPDRQDARLRGYGIVIAAAVGGAVVGGVLEPNKPQYWIYLAAAAAITARWARNRTALGAGLGVVGVLGIAGGAVWSVLASAIPLVVAIATAVRTSVGLQVGHVAVVAVGSLAALLAPAAMGAEPIVSVVVWSVVTAALVAGSRRLSRGRPPA